MSGRIVVGVDGSEPSLVALRWAADEARRRDAGLDVVHAWHFPYGEAPPVESMPTFPDLDQAAWLRLEQILEAEGLTDSEAPPVRGIVKQGGAAVSLLEEAEGADLLVVGSHGRGRFRGMLLGSVSQHCASHAPCPVVIVRWNSDD